MLYTKYTYFTSSNKRNKAMMINTNYSEIIAQAKINGTSHVNFDKTSQTVQAITAEKDTFTLSDAAMAKMKGESVEEIAPTYVKPETAKELLEKNVDEATIKKSARDSRFDEVMQNILDQRLGVDRKKLEEIEAMMEQIAKNENLSPEEKQKAMEELEKMREQVIEESMDVKKQAKQTFATEEV